MNTPYWNGRHRRSMDECVVSGDRSSSILHEHGHILKSTMIPCLWAKCPYGSIDPAQRLSTLIPARQDGTPVTSWTIYSVTITQESHLCKCGSVARLSLKVETFHACDFSSSRIGTQLYGNICLNFSICAYVPNIVCGTIERAPSIENTRPL